MIEYVNSFLLFTLLGTTYYVYYKYRTFFRVIHILTDSAILSQLNSLEKAVDSEVTKSGKGCRKKDNTEINEVEENDVRDKREILIGCVLSGNSKQYLGITIY